MSRSGSSSRQPAADVNPFQLSSDDEDADAKSSSPSAREQSTSKPSESEPAWASEADPQAVMTKPSREPPSSESMSSATMQRGGSHRSQTSQSGFSSTGNSNAHHQPIPAPEIDMSDLAIIDAQKTTDHVGASSFIVYVIRCGNTEAKRRYSEFEALRSALVALYPTLIIPPIPSKHSLSDYAVKQSKAKEDATIIARRRRMLQSFLRRCAGHPELQQGEVFRKFLDGRWSWHEISTSPPISRLPKSNLKAPPSNPADPNASPAYASLPLPTSSSIQLRAPSQRFIDSEAFTNRFAAHMSGSLEKANRRVARRWGDASGDFAELGAVLNGFSLSETGQLSTAIERTGQASDSTFMSIGGLLQDWEQSMTEPLHEYVQFAAILQKLLKWRHMKHLQYELAQDALEAKKLKLDDLERVEAEAKRLERALETGGRSLTDGSGRPRGGGHAGPGVGGAWDSTGRGKSSIYGGAMEGEEGGEGIDNGPRNWGDDAGWSDGIGQRGDRPAPPKAPETSPKASYTRDPSMPSRSSGSGYGIFSALSHTFSSVLDADPESTRRREISRLREDILLLDEALQLTAQDLKEATQKIQADLDRFQRMKIRDFKEVLVRSAKMHREFCRINLQNWQEAQAEIGKIERKTVSVNGDAEGDWPSSVMPESSLTRKEDEEQLSRRGRV